MGMQCMHKSIIQFEMLCHCENELSLWRGHPISTSYSNNNISNQFWMNQKCDEITEFVHQTFVIRWSMDNGEQIPFHIWMTAYLINMVHKSLLLRIEIKYYWHHLSVSHLSHSFCTQQLTHTVSLLLSLSISLCSACIPN